MMDGAADFAPYAETYTSEKLPFAETGAVRSYKKFPPMEAYKAVMQAYGEWVEGRGKGRP